jgi:hypothetical protein
VKRLAEARLADIDRKIEELRGMRAALAALVDACRGDHRPDCPTPRRAPNSADRWRTPFRHFVAYRHG